MKYKKDSGIKYSYLLNKILLCPQLVLFSLFLFILHKNFGANAFQLAVAAAIKPLSSLPAYLLGHWLSLNLKKVKLYLAALLITSSSAPLLFPFFTHVWYAIAVYALYMVASKAMVPPWIEAAKRELRREAQCTLFAQGNAVYYAANLVLPLLFSQLLDCYGEWWYFTFAAASLIQLLTLPLLLKFPSIENMEKAVSQSSLSPLCKDSSFIRYLLLFFVGGSSFVLLQPILPLYFQDVLHLSYTEVALGFSVAKGFAFLLTTPIWAKLSHKISIYMLNVFLLLFSILYISSLAAGCILMAYLFYGALQGASEQSWTLSGPYFSKEKESIQLTSSSYLIGAIRGAFVPFLGTYLYQQFGVEALFVCALFPALWGVLYGLSLVKRENKV